MYCDREKTSKLEAGSAHKAAWKPQGAAEQHGVTQKETNTNVSCLLVLVCYRLQVTTYY